MITRSDLITQVTLSKSIFYIFIKYSSQLGFVSGLGLGLGLGLYRYLNAFDYLTYVHVDIVYTFYNHAQLVMLTSIMYMHLLYTHYLHVPFR